MSGFRPAGMSDEDTDSEDDYGYFEKLNRNQNYARQLENVKQKTETKLQEAIINGNLEEVKNITSNDLGNNMNANLESGWTPLSHACFHGKDVIVQYLLDNGANPNTHADSQSPIMMACINTSADEKTAYNIVSNLINHDALVNIGDKYGVTPLMRAVASGRPSVVELIIENKVNIEMRDSHGWTAVFWAIHHNQPKCLEILLNKGARLNIVDLQNRTPESIAYAHDFDEVLEVISKYTNTLDNSQSNKTDISDPECVVNKYTRWQDYYPGLRDENSPKYGFEIPILLYGMNCDRLFKTFEDNPMDLRDFLLLEDDGMQKLGINMPFERQRLKVGLRGFHMRNWKIKSVAGLQTRVGKAYSILDCVNILGSHLQQLYILEATLAYVLRDYTRNQNQIKFEPPDSPIIERLQQAAKKITANINNIRREINAMKKIHNRISKDSLKPVDLITEKSTKEVAVEIFSKIVLVSSIGFALYYAKNYVTNMLNK